MDREALTDLSPWLTKAGYSRAVRVGSFIYVKGATDQGDDGEATQSGDTYAQAKSGLERRLAAAMALGATKETVLRTRMFLAPGANVGEAAKAHL